MEYLNKNVFLILLLFLLLLNGCNSDDTVEEKSLQPGTPAYFYDQGLSTSDMEEKLRLYNAGLKAISTKRDTNLVALLEGKVYVLLRQGKYDLSEDWIDSLIKAAEYQKDTFYLAKGYYRKSRLNAIRKNRELEFKNAFIARQLNLMAGDTSLAARRSFDMATAQMELGDYPGSQESAAETIKFIKPRVLVDSIFLSAAYNLIGLAYMDQGFNEDAIKEYRNALRFAAREKDSLTFLHNISIAYKNEEKYEEAINILEEIVSSDIPDSTSKSRFIDNLAYTRWLRDSTESVDTLFFKSLEMRKRLNDWLGLYTSYSHLSEYYEERNKEEAVKYARAGLEAAQKSSSATSEVAALKKLISLLKKDVEQKYIDRYILLHDSIDHANLKAKNYFAKIKLDEQKKQKEINSLEQINYRQTLEAERLENRNLISSLGLIVIFLTAVLLFFYFRYRSKREKIRDIYRTEKRISKRIHDELANEVYNLMSSLEEEASPETADKLAKIYYRTRDISRENSEIETGNNFLNNLLSSISSLAGNTKVVLTGGKSIEWQKVEEEKKIVIYRVLQELMINMKKHSKAKFVAVSFGLNGKWLEINYKDNGAGCDLSCLSSGNGIKNLRSRISSVNGKVHIESERGNGFGVNIRIPA